MFYPKASCCPFNSEDNINSSDINNSNLCVSNLENEDNICTQNEMMKKIQEVDFAIIDLNLFLDTHPECSEALELFTKLSATSKSLKSDYQSKYGPLYVTKAAPTVPFDWVDPCRKWPWEI